MNSEFKIQDLPSFDDQSEISNHNLKLFPPLLTRGLLLLLSNER
ncbi:MAG TPA: hypothetical protein VF721_15850 [Pyrinomonadaceae bacterium]